MFNSKITAMPPSGTKPVMQLIAPATGDITHLNELTHPLCQQGLLGDGVAITMTKGDVFTPVDCKIESINIAKAQVRLVSMKGLKMLLQIGEPGAVIMGERLLMHVKAGQRCTANTLIAQCDPLWIKLNGHAPVCILTLLNTAKLTALQVMPGRAVRAGDEEFMMLHA
ncbi:MAG: PTS glucose transporter subunit IIA [Alteromonadaceae bacterium]|nr:PTS glucose transporter subunit IIA [Alteromonadaceae bacterium]